jgi:NADPH:quinone reductase-like Zn-dependent oxidoreductase
MIRAIEHGRIKPIIDTVVPFDHVIEGFRQQAANAFVGKIVVSM